MAKRKPEPEPVHRSSVMRDSLERIANLEIALDAIGKHLESIDDSLKTIRDIYKEQTGFHSIDQYRTHDGDILRRCAAVWIRKRGTREPSEKGFHS